MPAHLSAAGRDADQCAGIFAPVGVGTLKNQAAALNGTDGTGIGPLWGGDWEELAVYENGGGSALGFSVDTVRETWSVDTPLYGDFVIGIKQSTEVAFYFFADAAGASGGRFKIDPNFKGSGFSNARIYGRKKAQAAIRLDKQAGTVAANAGGTFDVPITLTVENKGSEDLISLQIEDNLDIFGAGHVTAISQLEVLAGSLSLNPGYDGLRDIGLLTGADKLPGRATARLRFVVTFDPAGEPGPFVNRATARGIGKKSRRLVSDDAQATISLPSIPGISLIKKIGSIEPVGDGTFKAPVTLTVGNTGSEALKKVEVDDSLAIFTPGGQLLGVAGPTSSTLTVNPAYNGSTDIHVLAGSDTLEVDKQGSVTFSVHFACTPNSGPFKNTATATGSGVTSNVHVDTQAGANIACPAKPSGPPAISLTKQIGQVEAVGDGTFKAPVTLTVKNTGGEVLNGVGVDDPLDIFAPGGQLLDVTAPASAALTVNPAYNGLGDSHVLAGTDTLAVGQQGSATFTVHFACTPSSGPFKNTATATGAGLSSTAQVEAQARADIACPATPSGPPAISLTKQIGAIEAVGDGTFKAPVTLTVRNAGGEALKKVGVDDSLAIFAPGGQLLGVAGLASATLTVNPAYNGGSDVHVLAGTDMLALGKQGSVTFSVHFACTPSSGPFKNRATAAGSGVTSNVHVDAQAEADIACPATPTGPPAISLTKQIGQVVAVGDGTFKAPVTLTVKNAGGEVLNGVRVDDPLDIFAPGGQLLDVTAPASATLTVNPAYNGLGDSRVLAGSDALAVGQQGSVTFSVHFACTPTSGPFKNTATATGSGATSTVQVDTQAEANIACSATPAGPAAISLTKQIGQVVAVGDGTFKAPVSLTVENTGGEALNAVGVDDPLDIFAPGGQLLDVASLTSSTLTVNPAYNGLGDIHVLVGADALAVGQQGSVTFSVHFACTPSSGPFKNTATATGAGATSTAQVDTQAQADIACPATPTGPPAISLTKQIGSIEAVGDGTFKAPVTLTVGNAGGEALTQVGVDDSLAIFTAGGQLLGVESLASSTLTVNPAYDGGSDIHVLAGSDTLAAGQQGSVTFSVHFVCTPTSGPFKNTATATGSATTGTARVDAQAQADIACPATPSTTPAISLKKQIGEAEAVGDGTYEAPVTLTVENTGDEPLVTLKLEESLDIFGSGRVIAVTGLTGNSLTVNRSFNGVGDTHVLSGSDSLAVGASGNVTFTVVFDPGIETGPFTIHASAAATGQTSGKAVTAAVDADIVLPRPPPPITVTKTADRSQITRGEAVAYDVRIDSTADVVISGIEILDDLPAGFRLIDGSATLIEPGPDGVFDTADDAVTHIPSSGTDPVRFGPFDLPPNGKFLIRYVARASSGIPQGDYTNSATLLIDGAVSGVPAATATVSLVPDPMFEQTTVIGKVFDDRNGNGVQDRDEPGVPGVRLATVAGLLVETDAYGRYHLAAIDIARFERGANFIIKLDESTLPVGTKVLSENPRVIRLTEAGMSRINFAVGVPKLPIPRPVLTTCVQDCTTTTTRVVRGQVEPVQFETGSWNISTDYLAHLKEFVDAYSNKQAVRLHFVGHTDSDPIYGNLARELGAGEEGNLELSRRRARAVCLFVRDTGGLPADCDRVEGRGSSEPIDTSGTAAAKARNRRVEIELLYDETVTNRTRKLDVCPGPAFYDATNALGPKPPADGETTTCDVIVGHFAETPAGATDVRVSGGPFPCAARGPDLPARVGEGSPPASLTVEADPAAVVPGQPCANGRLVAISGLASPELTVNSAGDRLTDPGLLAAGNALEPGASATASFTVEFDPGSELGPFVDSVLARGESSGGAVSAEADAVIVLPSGATDGGAPRTSSSGLELSAEAGTVAEMADGRLSVPITVTVRNSGTGVVTNLDLRNVFGSGIRAGEFPIEIRTAEGSVHRINRAGDALRQAFPTDSGQWIVVTPFRDETDNTLVTALRISNLAVDPGKAVVTGADTSSAAGSQDSGGGDSVNEPASVQYSVEGTMLKDLRLDVLALDSAELDARGRLRRGRVVRFAGYTNYETFIRRYTIEIRGRSSTGARLLRTIDVANVRYGAPIEFDGNDDDGNPLNLGQYETIEYVLKAFSCAEQNHDRNCEVDVTRPRLLTLLDGPSTHPAERRAEELWGQSNLAEQRIRVDGRRVRIFGQGFVAGQPVTINGASVPTGADGRFVLEQYLAPGKHDVGVIGEDRGAAGTKTESGASAEWIEISGGTFGCNRRVNRELPGRDPKGSVQETPAVTVAANLQTEDPCGQQPDHYLTLMTSNGTKLHLTRAGDVLRDQEPDNGERLVITPFRDDTDNTLVTALRIANEGVDASRVDARYDFAFEVPKDIPQNDHFVVALANLTIGKNDVSGDEALLAGDPHFDGSLFTDGRLALYAKSRFKQKYGLTAQLDTTEDELRNLFDNLQRKDPYRLFRQLDSKRYYATYGDDSTTTSDVDTQGAFYMRLDWDRSQALLGNFNTGLTDTELTQYDRSLFGANLNLETSSTTSFGDVTREIKVFGSEAQSLPAHVTFKATGGSLYYLKHTDIVQGSEKLSIEVRQRDTEQVLEREILLEGRDYEIDPIQGRIILRRPLSQVASDSSTSIIRTRALEGDDVFLLADYEYVPQSFSGDNLTSGVRGKAWVGDHVAIGATQVTDQRAGVDYDLHGVDLTVKLGAGTYFTAEVAQSEARQNEAGFISYDGGLTFKSQASTAASDTLAGDAVALEGRIDLGEVSHDRVAGDVRAWHKTRDAEFSTGRLDDGIATNDTGVEAHFRAGERLTVTTGYTELERELVSKVTTARVQADANLGRLTAGVEVRRESLERLGSQLVRGLTAGGTSGEALLVGARIGYALRDDTTLYARAQTTADDRGAYKSNDLVGVGVKRRINDTFALSLEASDGDRGSALTSGVDVSVHGVNLNVSSGIGSGAVSQFSTSYSVAEGRELYGSYAVDPDRTDGQRNLLTLGQRRALGNHLDIFTESQFGKDDRYASVGHVFGLDFDAANDWRIRGSVEYGDNRDNADGIARKAVSLGGYRQTEDLKLSSRVEYREDEGSGLHTKQYLTSNSFAKRVNENRRWLGSLNLSWTNDTLNGGREAGYAELDIGHAYRPVTNDRLNIVAKYSYLYDLVGADQKAGRSDERSHLISVDTLYELTPRWEIGGKLAVKQGDRRLARDGGPWLGLNLRLALARARYSVTNTWDVLAEYRWLSDDDTTRRGVLVGGYRNVSERFKVGVGYNFTDFDDDLRSDGYDNRGWFIDLVGKY